MCRLLQLAPTAAIGAGGDVLFFGEELVDCDFEISYVPEYGPANERSRDFSEEALGEIELGQRG